MLQVATCAGIGDLNGCQPFLSKEHHPLADDRCCLTEQPGYACRNRQAVERAQAVGVGLCCPCQPGEPGGALFSLVIRTGRGTEADETGNEST